MVKEDKNLFVAEASFGQMPDAPFGESAGAFYLPYGYNNAAVGLTPEKLVVPKEYHTVLQMCYDFYQRGGVIGKKCALLELRPMPWRTVPSFGFVVHVGKPREPSIYWRK